MKFIIFVVSAFALSASLYAAPSSSNDIAMPSDYKKLKLGLWETTRRSEIATPPIEMSAAQLGTLDPAARARVEAVLKRQAAERAARNGAPEVIVKTAQECVTQEVLDKRNLSPNSDRRGNDPMKDCPPVLKTRTANRIVVTGECTIEGGKFSTELIFEVKSPEETFTSVTSSGNFGGRASKTAGSASSRWLGAVCGSAKLAK